MVLFIGLGHTSRCGKDTVANSLVYHLTAMNIAAKKIPFAWKLKEIAYDLYSWAGVERPEHYETKEGEQDRDIKLTALASDLFPDGPTVVELWIAIGTPAFRDAVHPDTWVNFVTKQDHSADVIVVPDCRFPNETDAIRGAGGYSFNCVRPGTPGRNSVADNMMRSKGKWDSTIGGNSLSELHNQAYLIAQAIYLKRDVASACVNPKHWESVYERNNLGFARMSH